MYRWCWSSLALVDVSVVTDVVVTDAVVVDVAVVDIAVVDVVVVDINASHLVFLLLATIAREVAGCCPQCQTCHCHHATVVTATAPSSNNKQ